jgi:sugar lactone lactonase YvrE
MHAMQRIAISISLLLSVGVARAADVQTVLLFDAAAAETPESIAFDLDGTTYISMALRGEIRMISPDGQQSTHAWLPIESDRVPCENAFGTGIIAAIALDEQGTLYVSVTSCNPAMTGVWRVTRAGDLTLVAGLPADAFPNGIMFHAGMLYVADTNLGAIWQIPASGGAARIWAQGGLLEPLPDFFPGPNGLQLFHDEIYVSVSDRMHIVAFPLLPDGSAGTPRVHATGVAMDDFAFDVNGNLYGTTDPFNTVVLVRPDGTSEVLLTAADGLDGPSAATFGRGVDDKQALYITNAAFPFFSTTHRPSVLKLEIGIPGKPRP